MSNLIAGSGNDPNHPKFDTIRRCKFRGSGHFKIDIGDSRCIIDSCLQLDTSGIFSGGSFLFGNLIDSLGQVIVKHNTILGNSSQTVMCNTCDSADAAKLDLSNNNWGTNDTLQIATYLGNLCGNCGWININSGQFSPITTYDPNKIPWNKNNCEIDSIAVKKTIGTEENEYTNFLIYPNPTRDFIKINQISAFTEALKVSLISSNGEQIRYNIGSNHSDEIEIDVSNLVTGVYILRLSDNQKIAWKKVIVIR